MPDITLALSVSNGLISYPALPEQIKNINIKSNVFVDGKDMDKTIVGVDLFHMELAGSPFDMTFALKTPMSDPDFRGSMVGRIDLSAQASAFGITYKPSDFLKMNIKVTGTFSKPVVAPFFGSTTGVRQ